MEDDVSVNNFTNGGGDMNFKENGLFDHQNESRRTYGENDKHLSTVPSSDSPSGRAKTSQGYSPIDDTDEPPKWIDGVVTYLLYDIRRSHLGYSLDLLFWLIVDEPEELSPNSTTPRLCLASINTKNS